MTFRALTDEQTRDLDETKARKLFDEKIEQRLRPSAKPEGFDDHGNIELTSPDLYEDEEQKEVLAPDQDEIPCNTYDNYIGAKLTIQKGDEVTNARVKRRKIDEFGSAIGTANNNPLLDMCLNVREFPDRAEAEYSAIVIAENIWAQCNIDANQYQLLEAIIDHKSS